MRECVVALCGMLRQDAQMLMQTSHHIFPPCAVENIRSWAMLMKPPRRVRPRHVPSKAPLLQRYATYPPRVLPNVTSPIMRLTPPPRPGCPCVCLKYCPHNVHKAPETNQGPPLVCQTHSCVDNALIIDYTLLSASPRTASITPPVDPPSPRSPSVFTVHGLQGFFYSFPLPRAGAQDFGDSEGNKSISLGSDSLCTWAERSQLGQRLVSLTKQPELSDGGGGLAKGMAKRANVGRLGWCSQGSAGRHRRAKTGRNITSMFQIRRATQQQRLGGNRKGD